jgi:hypothetical protein
MWWRIPLEILLGILLLSIGSGFWAILKSRGHLRKVLADETELNRFLDFLTPAKVVEEGRDIKPMFESYLQNIQFFERAHFAALNKTRNLTFIVALILIAISYFLGLPYLIASLVTFLLPSLAGIPASAKNNNLTHVHTVILNIYKWNDTDHDGCSRYCEQESSGLRQVYRMVSRLV